MRSKSDDGVLSRCFEIFSKRDRRKLTYVAIIQVALGAFDLVGVALVGVLGALAVTGVESHQAGNRVNSVLNLLSISNLKFRDQIEILGGLAVFVLFSRTLLSIFFTRRILHFLSLRSAALSADLFGRVLSQSLIGLREKSSQEVLFSVTVGVDTVALGIVGAFISMLSDVSLLMVMAIGLFIVDPIMSLTTFFVFALIGASLYFNLHKRAHILGTRHRELTIESNSKILEALGSYREAVVRDRRWLYVKQVKSMREKIASTSAELTFLPNIGKYVIETTVLLGALLISGIQFARNDAVHAVATLGVFMAASARIAPAVLRIQQGAVQMRGHLSIAASTLDYLTSLAPQVERDASTHKAIDYKYEKFSPSIILDKVKFRYPDSAVNVVDSISMDIKAGELISIVGSSGAGKSTLVDLILGIFPPDEGSIFVSGVDSKIAYSSWPGAVSYVPQDVMIVDGTIRDNIALGLIEGEYTDDQIWEALTKANLSKSVESMVGNLDAIVGERGTKLSGGQRQRLGIARALMSKPKLLILDEATSSLDGFTESEITKSILDLRGEVTIIMIAHRLSTVRASDRIYYLSGGDVAAVGTFEEVRALIPDFDQQAKLMGL
jgi:ATP-binding cassette subfamily C protein